MVLGRMIVLVGTGNLASCSERKFLCGAYLISKFKKKIVVAMVK
jgi:hypothetical protein